MSCSCQKPTRTARAVSGVSPIAILQSGDDTHPFERGFSGLLGEVLPLPGALVQFNRAKASTLKRAGHMGSLRLGRLGSSVLLEEGASRGASVAATYGGAAVGSALATGAGYGSVAGPVGAVVGAAVGLVVGLLTSKLFGHANQGQILNDVTTRMKYADAYKQLPPGSYPGRAITTPDLQMVWYGLLHESYFPQAEACGGAVLHASLCPPQYPKCNCGAESWANGMMNGTANYEFPTIINQALSQGVTNPITIVDSYLIPGITNLSMGSKNAHWAIPSNTTNPALVRQLYIDIADAYVANKNPNAPVYYGSASVAQTQAAATPTPQYHPTQSGGVQPIMSNTGAAKPAASPNGSMIQAGSAGSVVDAHGTIFSFESGLVKAGAPDHYISVDGVTNGGAVILTIENGTASATNSFGDVYQWGGAGWVKVASAPAPAPTPATTPAPPTSSVPVSPAQYSQNGAQISTGSPGGTLTTAQGTWTLSGSSAMLNGGGTNSPPFSAVAMLNGQPVGLGIDGSTWGWTGSAWTQLSPPSASLASPAQAGVPAPASYSSGGGSPLDSAYQASLLPVQPQVDTSAPGASGGAPVATASLGSGNATMNAIGVVAGVVMLSLALARPAPAGNVRRARVRHARARKAVRR